MSSIEAPLRLLHYVRQPSIRPRRFQITRTETATNCIENGINIDTIRFLQRDYKSISNGILAIS
jgi:hypothetical protein